MMPFLFEKDMSFEKYVDFVLDVPMYFIKRDKYIDVSGKSFKTFLKGELPGFEGNFPTISDWENHLSTVFPEVRLKRFLEMRGADSGSWNRLCALPAFWTGILYDNSSLCAAWDIAKNWTRKDREGLYMDAPNLGLNTEVAGRKVRDIAIDLIDISRNGLKTRSNVDKNGDDETVFLNPLQETVDLGKTPAEIMLEKFYNKWNGNINNIFEEYGY